MEPFKTLILPHERVDDLELAGLVSIQNPDAFRYGLDSVLLAHFANAKPNMHVLDLGTGSGILPLLLYGRYQCEHITGIEILPDMADMARRSVLLNRIEERISVVTGDYRNDALVQSLGKFDMVVSNPPYLRIQDGKISEVAEEAVARHEVMAKLSDTVQAASLALEQGGRFCVVYLARRAEELFVAMNVVGIIPKRAQLVQSSIHKAPNLILVEGVKYAKRDMLWQPTLIVNNEDGSYSKQMQQIYQTEG